MVFEKIDFFELLHFRDYLPFEAEIQKSADVMHIFII